MSIRFVTQDVLNTEIFHVEKTRQNVCTAGLSVNYKPTKNQFASEPEELRQFRDHRWKSLGEKN